MSWPAGVARFQGSPAPAPAPYRRDFDDEGEGSGWAPFSAHSNAGVDVNQGTALKATTVMAAVTMLCEDFAKCEPVLYRLDSSKKRVEATDHELYQLFVAPNEWQTWFEFAEMMQFSLVLRGNAYAVKIRDRRGRVVRLIPVNADWCALWESPEGPLFYRVTPNGLHLRAELIGQPFLIPAEDVLHIKGFSMNGLVGASRIALANDAIGLAIAYERQATQWFSNGAMPSGVLTTDERLQDGAAKRMADDWRGMKAGLQNAGKILVLEQGLKYQQIAMTAQAAEFVASRNFQIQEVTRIFRIPAHMLGDLQRATMSNIEQLSQEYINLTITGYTGRWGSRMTRDWDLKRDGLYLDFNLNVLTRANVTARYNNYARGITGGFLTRNEAREDDHRDPKPGGDELLQPLNMSAQGSHATGAGADGGGRPPEGDANASVKPRRLRDFDPDQPRDDHGRWTSGGMTPEDAQKNYDERKVPDGFFVHGRAGSQELSDSSVIQMTQSVDVADQYAGADGSVWYLKPSSDAEVLDLSGAKAADEEKLGAAIEHSWENGTLPADAPEYASAREARDDMAPQFSPHDIVNSAEAFDNVSWTNWLYENTGATFVKTPDGAVALDKSAVDAVKVPNPVNGTGG